jgi:Holliday junction resolvase RusA-like endonuclease
VNLTITAIGRPAPQGSKNLGSAGQLLEQSAWLPAWKQAIKVGAFRAYQMAGILPTELPVFRAGVPVELLITFLLASDQSPTGKPDIDKLMRSTLDALGGGRAGTTARLYADDSQVVRLAGSKQRQAGRQPGAIIIATDEGF